MSPLYLSYIEQRQGCITDTQYNYFFNHWKFQYSEECASIGGNLRLWTSHSKLWQHSGKQFTTIFSQHKANNLVILLLEMYIENILIQGNYSTCTKNTASSWKVEGNHQTQCPLLEEQRSKCEGHTSRICHVSLGCYRLDNHNCIQWCLYNVLRKLHNRNDKIYIKWKYMSIKQ